LADARILLVEDDDLNQQLVRKVLARSGDPVLRGARLVQVASLAEARAALAGSAVDVVLLDMNLPDGSGLSLAAEVQRTGSGPAMVALTGAGPEQGDAALAAGCTAVLGKPYQAAQLCALVCAALSG
jgi:two-component system, OmpR family, KDP operon response regulator KdpE